MIYQPDKYWKGRKNPTRHDAIDAIASEFISSGVKPGDDVLDFGAGIGRAVPLYIKNAKSITTADIVGTYEDQLRARLAVYGKAYRIVRLRHESKTLPFYNQEFDVAIASQVLLHVLPEDIERTIAELCRVAKYVLITTFYTKEDVDLADHNFNHDYTAIIKKLRLQAFSQQEGNELFLKLKKVI